VRHVSAQKNTVGFRFTDLTGEQTSLLNHVLRSFISGEIVSGKDLLAVVSRENFVKVRHHNDVESDKSTFWKRQAIPFLLIGLLGLSALYVIVTNVYNGVFVLQSSQGYVSGNEINVRTPIAGTFSSQLPANAKSVQKGQLIGVVEPYGSVVTSSIQIVSPCDCSIVNQNVGQGEYVTKASPLISLVDKSDTPWVSAVITTQDAQRLLIGDTATILVAGQDIEIKGVIENFAVNDPGGAVVSASDGFDTGVRVRVQPQQKLPIALVGRPARIAFDL
jgi:alginate biosynthesis protein Alg44